MVLSSVEKVWSPSTRQILDFYLEEGNESENKEIISLAEEFKKMPHIDEVRIKYVSGNSVDISPPALLTAGGSFLNGIEMIKGFLNLEKNYVSND